MRAGAGSPWIGGQGRNFGLGHQIHSRRSNLATIVEDEDKCVQGPEGGSVPAGLDGFEQEMVLLNPEMRRDGVVPEYLGRSLPGRGRKKKGRKEHES
jgi:hypothetical protein